MTNYIILLYLSIQYLDIPKICMKNNIALGMCWGEVQEGEVYDYIMYE